MQRPPEWATYKDDDTMYKHWEARHIYKNALQACHGRLTYSEMKRMVTWRVSKHNWTETVGNIARFFFSLEQEHSRKKKNFSCGFAWVLDAAYGTIEVISL